MARQRAVNAPTKHLGQQALAEALAAGFEALQTAVREGLDSGPSGKTVPSIMKEVEARLRSDGRL